MPTTEWEHDALRAQLRKRGLDDTGSPAELMKRLGAHLRIKGQGRPGSAGRSRSDSEQARKRRALRAGLTTVEVGYVPELRLHVGRRYT